MAQEHNNKSTNLVIWIPHTLKVSKIILRVEFCTMTSSLYLITTDKGSSWTRKE